MELILHTQVNGNYRALLDRFNRALFLELAPTFPKLRLLRFDGSQPGDWVEIELVLGPFRQRWTSQITERQLTETEAWFTDEGAILPPPLKTWKHQHLVTKLSETESQITDHITFSTGNQLLDKLVFPILKAKFGARKPVYQRIFGRVS